jgi:CrcB protein
MNSRERQAIAGAELSGPSRFTPFLPILAISAGGALGACSRYAVSQFASEHWAHAFPIATLVINLTGSLVLSCFLTAIGGKNGRFTIPRLFFATGFLGAYTTFSTFSVETAHLMRDDKWGTAMLYLSISLIGGLVAALAGFKLARMCMNEDRHDD